MEKIVKTDAEWRAQLSDLAYKVTRKSGTERAFSNDNFPKSAGVFHCTCCDAPLFDMDTKFDSGTGWPSYWQPVSEGVVKSKTDFKLIYPRTECHCAVCGLHMGHVFKDGPPPTGQRWCINGVVLNFKPAQG